MKNNLNKFENIKKANKFEQGQILLFVVIAMSIALAIGISVSSRTLSSLSRTSRTDTASRVYAAAEGGIERYLQLSNANLGNLDSTTNSSSQIQTACGNLGLEYNSSYPLGCIVKYQVADENIVADAYVTVEKFSTNSGSSYKFNINSGQTKEVNLTSYSGTRVNICWYQTTVPADTPSLYVYTYNYNAGVPNQSMNYFKQLFQPNSGTAVAFSNTSDTVDLITVTPSSGKYCYDYTVSAVGYTSPIGLRIRALGNNATVEVTPASAVLPTQGYKITSKGFLQQEDTTKTIKTVIVYRSLPYVPFPLDSEIYSEGPITP